MSDKNDNDSIPPKKARKRVKLAPENRSKWTKKTGRITLRYTYEELEIIDKEVSELKTDLTKYLKAKIKNGKIKVQYIDQTYEKLHFELNKIGNNLNQIARHINEENGANIAGNIGFVRQGISDLRLIIQRIETEIDKQNKS